MAGKAKARGPGQPRQTPKARAGQAPKARGTAPASSQARASASAAPGKRRPAPPSARNAATLENASVTSRALRVLEVFAPTAPVRTLTDIARHTGLPLTTTHRLVGELTRWGALERDGDGGYRIGLRLWEVASLAPRGLGLRESALPQLSDLVHVTGENAQLAVREDLSVVYVERLAGRGAVPVLTRVAGRFALTPTGVGRVLLAHAPPEVQERALAEPKTHCTPRTECDPVALRRALAEVRRTGVAICEGQVTLDSMSVAAPVHDPGGAVVAAVSVVAHLGRVEPHTLIPLVQVAARGISRALGADTTPAHRADRAHGGEPAHGAGSAHRADQAHTMGAAPRTGTTHRP